jgi:hypothetical protein
VRREKIVYGYGTHRYESMSRQKVDALLRALRHYGAAVSGDNPWEVDTRQSGVKLRGRLDEAGSSLEITVVDRDWYVPCWTIWRRLDQLILRAQAITNGELAATEGQE